MGAFLEHVVFEGELRLRPGDMEPARDAASARSKISLRRAEAVLLYEDDAERGRRSGLRPLHYGPPLPRPTLAVFDENQDAAQVGRLREALCRFSGRGHPGLRAFRPAVPDRYLSLRWQLQRRAARLRLPRSAPLPVPLPPVRVYAR